MALVVAAAKLGICDIFPLLLGNVRSMGIVVGQARLYRSWDYSVHVWEMNKCLCALAEILKSKGFPQNCGVPVLIIRSLLQFFECTYIQQATHPTIGHNRWVVDICATPSSGRLLKIHQPRRKYRTSSKGDSNFCFKRWTP